MLYRYRVISALSVAALAVALANMPLASAAPTGLTVDPYIVPAPNGTTTITLSISIPSGVNARLVYWHVNEPDGDTCTITVPLNVPGPTTVTVNRIYPTDAALVTNVANDGCDTNDIGGTWNVYAALVTTSGTFRWDDHFTVSFHVIPESAIGIAAISSVGLATFAGYKILRSRSN